MSTDFDRAYEVLGIKPGVSDRELKAAHRDLAKVWHPDRFGHDPRLQEKAQEKLKEINEAYEQLISRHKRRVTPPPRDHAWTPRAQAADVASARSRHGVGRSGVGWHWWIAAPLALFALVFAFTTKTLLQDRQRPLNVTEIKESNQEAPARSEETTRAVRSRPSNNQVAAAEPALAPNGERASEPPSTNDVVAPVATVTVSIDPASGLLATPTCPVKTRMTYPSGSEPRAYCNVSHVVKTEKEPGIKRLAKRIL